jgi:hypothetical protein
LGKDLCSLLKPFFLVIIGGNTMIVGYVPDPCVIVSTRRTLIHIFMFLFNVTHTWYVDKRPVLGKCFSFLFPRAPLTLIMYHVDNIPIPQSLVWYLACDAIHASLMSWECFVFSYFPFTRHLPTYIHTWLWDRRVAKITSHFRVHHKK